MLTLKDLSADKEMDREALIEVRGGSANTVTNLVGVHSVGTGGFVGNSQVTVDQFGDIYDNDVYWSEEYSINIGSPTAFALT
jgi:hypothetical protein